MSGQLGQTLPARRAGPPPLFGTLAPSRRHRVRSRRDMADQTTSSIVIAADAASVMGVIADFPAYPTWAQGVRVAEVVEEQPDGRAKKVYFELDASPIKDSYTLEYDWNGDESV